jgi:hypothetical protein
MRRSFSTSVLAYAGETKHRPKNYHRIPSSPDLEANHASYLRGTTASSSDVLYWARLVCVFCVLGGCLLFSGTETSLPDTLEVKPLFSGHEGCAASLSYPKVALLFLLKGPLYHSEMWESWLDAASGVIPAEYLGAHVCEDTVFDFLTDEGDRMRDIDIDEVLLQCGSSQQHLFSVYVHLSQEIALEDVLEPRWIASTDNITRVPTKWGHHSLVEATRNMMARAFQDPNNERFVLLSETHIPTWDPLTLYRVITNERRSHINAYFHENMDTARWTKKMLPVIERNHWRKSQQWWMLIRDHVKLVLEDSDIFREFRKHCVYELDFDLLQHRKCFSDEHFFATLLSIMGVEDETIPFFKTATYVEWPQHSAHPKSFSSEEVTSGHLASKTRSHDQCPLSTSDQTQLLRVAANSFINVVDTFHSNAALQYGVEHVCDVSKSHGQYAAQASLPAGCTTFARKFDESTVDAVLQFLNEDLLDRSSI